MQNKKSRAIGIILISFLILNIFIIANSYVIPAQVDPGSGLPVEISGITEATEKLSQKEQRQEYLKKEWTKILEKKAIGRAILFVGKLFELLSPVFKILIGVEYSLSWIFFLSLGAWIFILFLIYTPAKYIFQANKWVALAIAVIIPTIAAQTKIIPTMIGFFLPLLSNKWMIMLSFGIGFIIIEVYYQVLKVIGAKLKEKTKKEDEERREQKAATTEKLNDIRIRGTKV